METDDPRRIATSEWMTTAPWVVIGTKWVSGIALQSPSAVGPIYIQEIAESVADRMEELGYMDIDIVCLYDNVTQWRNNHA